MYFLISSEKNIIMNKKKLMFTYNKINWRSYTFIASVRRRGENIHPQILYYLKKWQMWGDKDSCLLLVKKWKGSRHLVFWSLETLTGLRDRVRGLIA
jgi:hypothetical protein